MAAIYLLPNTLGQDNFDYIIPKDVVNIIDSLTYFIVENEKTARAYIKHLLPEKNQRELRLEILDKQTDPLDLPYFLDPIKKGHSVGVLSEAGVPCVADPGASIVSIAHRKGIEVRPCVGPSSILLALMASGFNGQQFTFRGYLPHDKPIRKRVFQAMQKDIRDGITQIFMETPYRNGKLMEELVANLHPETKLCIAVDITLDTEKIKTQTVAQWRLDVPELHKRPAIFLID
ncbi:SAM-dependent methyltransferase [Schleiferiaceae bacterium]|nr:SAM-dependent methyltransferase [Schleiferiaceae bacterium]MDC0376411.1 SAM-dependent methyltransferase [Schleiferiaceae bacterium]